MFRIIKYLKWFIFNWLFFKNDYGICAGAWILYNFDVKSWEYGKNFTKCKYLLTSGFDKIVFKRQLLNRKNLTWVFKVLKHDFRDDGKETIVIEGKLYQKDYPVTEMQCTLVEASKIWKK